MKRKQQLVVIGKYVKKYFAEFQQPGYQFHNFKRTKAIISAVEKLLKKTTVTEDDQFILLTAAWFREIDLATNTDGRRLSASGIAKNLLISQQTDPALIEKVQELIMVTEETAPVDKALPSILLDALYAYAGKKSFEALTGKLRRETEKVKEKKVSKIAWLTETYEWMGLFHYRTDRARSLWEKGFQKNLSKVKLALNKRSVPADLVTPKKKDRRTDEGIC